MRSAETSSEIIDNLFDSAATCVSDLGFEVWISALEFGGLGFGFRVSGLGFWVWVYGFGVWVWSLEFGVWGEG
jgi:hypothetical protein